MRQDRKRKEKEEERRSLEGILHNIMNKEEY